jgi:hypothetical protein
MGSHRRLQSRRGTRGKLAQGRWLQQDGTGRLELGGDQGREAEGAFGVEDSSLCLLWPDQHRRAPEGRARQLLVKEGTWVMAGRQQVSLMSVTTCQLPGDSVPTLPAPTSFREFGKFCHFGGDSARRAGLGEVFSHPENLCSPRSPWAIAKVQPPHQLLSFCRQVN